MAVVQENPGGEIHEPEEKKVEPKVVEEVKKEPSYKNDPKDKCWYDECNCTDVRPADCEALVVENDAGIGRFACLVDSVKCWDRKFMARAFKKITCQFEHLIQNICAIWDLLQCIIDFLKKLADLGEYKYNYSRNSAVSSQDFYRPLTESYDVELYMNSATGVDGKNDDKHREVADRDYRVWVRWCADGTTLDPNTDNTMEMVLYHSGEQYTEDMKRQRGVHWQMMGMKDGAMEMSDSLFLPKGQFLKLHVQSSNSSSGIFRVHQFRVEYQPILQKVDLPDCLK